MANLIPLKFQVQNASVSKRLIVVVQFEGVDDIFTTGGVGSPITYGDGTLYGESGADGPYVYGGLRDFQGDNGGTVKPYLMLDGSNLTIDQRLEPEQGRASVSQFSLCFLDYRGYFTNLCTPGNVVPDIMGRAATVYIGYAGLSFPDDYLICFRGIVQGINFQGGRCVFQLGDCGIKRRQQIFFTAKALLTGGISDSDTTINVDDNSDFFQIILDAFGNEDDDARTYIKIDDEYIEYNRQAKAVNSFNEVAVGAVITRGARGSTAAAHLLGAEVFASVELEGNPVELILKVMLSGWNGPWLQNQPIQSFCFTSDPLLGVQDNAIVLPDSVDAVRQYGLAVGDEMTITGATNPGNNIQTSIESFGPKNGMPNRIIYVSNTLVLEPSTSAVFSSRSQYDTLPVEAGMKMRGSEVDVASHQAILSSFFAQESVRIFQQQPEYSGKEFIESQLNLPLTLYSLTIEGRVGIKATLPPIAGTQLQRITPDVVLSPATTTVIRSLSNRTFYNQVDYEYDESDDGVFGRQFSAIDSDSLDNIGILSVLPIQSRATKSGLTSVTQIENRVERMLARYKNGAILYQLQVNFGAGIGLNIGDVVLLEDDGILQIPNLATGERNITPQLVEVVGRSMDIRTGRCDLKLLSAVNFSIQDRFGTFAPSSYLADSSTSTVLVVLPSFGAKFGLNEFLKWVDYVGMSVLVHNEDFSQTSSSVIQSVSPSGQITVSPALSFDPDSTHILELGEYSSDAMSDIVSKQVHGFWDATVDVASGVSATVFSVGAGDIAKFSVGIPIYVRDDDWGAVSPERTITDITGNQITVNGSLGFTPNNTQKVELGLFPDGGAPYRFI